MNKKIWSAACGALVAGAMTAVFAQAPTPSESQSTSAKAVTVTGCVARAEQSPTGTSGTSGAATTTEPKFILKNAESSASTASGATGTSGSASASAMGNASEYRLDASDSKLSDHVGHKVEITGTIEKASPREQSAAGASSSAPTLKVDNVKMIASSCSGQ